MIASFLPLLNIRSQVIRLAVEGDGIYSKPSKLNFWDFRRDAGMKVRLEFVDVGF